MPNTNCIFYVFMRTSQNFVIQLGQLKETSIVGGATMDEKMKYTKICEIITKAIGKHIPERYVDVMFDSINYIYFVKITNKFGVAEYKFLWSTVLDYGVNYIVDVIQRDFIFSKELEEV